MKPSIIRGNRFDRFCLGSPARAFWVLWVFLAWWGVGVDTARAQVYPKEYIRVQPLSVIVREGDGITLDVEYAFGQDIQDQTSVQWYRNGVLVGTSLPVLQTYTTPAGAFPKLWDPYKMPRGQVYEDAASVATANLADARARWVATFTIPAVSAAEAGMYYAKVADTSTYYNWTYTNFAQVAMVPKEPSQSMEVVRNPVSKSLSAPNSDPVPGIKLFGDMHSHISPIFHTPFGTATDADGFTYIADTLNHCIRKVSPGGHVTTLAGMDGQPYAYVEPSQYDPTKRDARTRKERDPVPGFRAGITNQSLVPGDATAYRFLSSYDPTNQNEPLFKAPEAIAVSDIGVVYVADTGNNAIRGIRTVGNVTTVFDLYGNPGSSNLKSPRGIFFSGSSSDPINNPPVLYVLDSANYSVKKLYLNELNGSLDTSKGDPEQFPSFPNQRTGCERIAGLGQIPGWQGVAVSAADAKFYSPRGIVFTLDPATGAETIYIADTVNHVIRQLVRVNNTWTARTVVGFVGAKGNVDAVGSAARLNFPVGLALDEVNQLLYFTEFGNHCLRRVNLPYNSRNLPSWTVDRVAGTGFYGPTLFGPNGAQGSGNGDGLGTAAVFYYPAGISFNKVDGSILLADTNNNVVRKIRIATSGTNAWVGDSASFAGTVGVAGNRDFSDLPEFTYHWKKDALLMSDNAPAAVSSISGSLTDTLTVTNVQYEDAGVYALVVTNAFEEQVETSQAFVYIATAGDQPKFMSPGYRIENQVAPGIPLVDLQQGMDIFVAADILPADQVTYQWEVAEDLPDENGDYEWIALSDLPIGIQTLNNPKDVDTVKNAQRIRLGTLLGTSTTTISGSTTSRLAIGKLQASLSSNIPPKLRFRVQAFTKAVPPLPLDTKVDTTSLSATWTVSPAQTVTVVDATGLLVGMTLSGPGITPGTKIKAINGLVLTLDTPASGDGTGQSLTATLGDTTLNPTGTWTAVPEQTVTVDTAEGLSVGMYLVGPGIAADSKIKSIDTSNPLAVVLTLDTPVTAPGTNVQISGAVDFVAGTGLSIRYPVILTNPNLSYQLDSGSVSQLSNLQTLDVANPQTVTLVLTAGTSAALGNPEPTYQWYRKDSVSGTPVLVPGATQTTLSFSPVQSADRGYYFVAVSNGVGSAANSNTVLVNVARPPSLTILSLSLDGGTLTQNVTSTAERVVDKTKSPILTLTANVDASVKPTYTWQFVPDDPASPVDDFSKVGASPADEQLAYVSLSIPNFPDNGDGVFTLTANVPASGSSPAVTKTCAWHVVVKALPQYVPGSKVFQVGTVDVSGDSYTVDLNELNTLYLKADFTSPRTLPLTYRWRRDKVILASGTNSLSLDRVIKTDMGTYKLEVSNAMGTLVFGPVSGSEVPFPGTPPQAGWKLMASGKPSVVIQPNGKVLASTGANVSAALAGMVAAPVAAPSLKAMAASGLSVDVVRVARGQRIALQVAVDADPAPTYQWYRARENDVLFTAVTGAKSAIYVLPTATDPVATVWRYYVVAKNSLGEVRSDEVVVRVGGLPEPEITLLPALPGADPRSVSLTVYDKTDNSQDAGYTYQWKLNGSPIFGAISKDLKLDKLGAGSYSVVVTGIAGSKESAVYTHKVTNAVLAQRYMVYLEGADDLRVFTASPSLSALGLPYGQKVTLSGLAKDNRLLQSWRVSYTDPDGNEVSSLLPARSAVFMMPAADVTVTPLISREYTGNYVGLLSLEAPWLLDDEWAQAEGREGDFFRPRGMEPGLGNIRGLFNCAVSALGAVSGQIHLENKIYSFTTVLDAEMRGSFKIATTLKGMAWNLTGTIAFNSTEENRLRGYVDNSLHVVLKDVLLATPPVVQVGQTLYAAAVGISGATDALRADVIEAVSPGGTDTQEPTLATPLQFTAAVYREINGETKSNSYGQAAVLAVQLRQVMSAAIVQGYLANGTKVTFSTYLGRPFITPQMEGPDILQIDPNVVAAVPFLPSASATLSGQATEALTETLLRRSSSQSLVLWFRGDSATEPLFGTMIFNGPRVYGSLGALNLNSSTKLSEYTPNALAGYFYDQTEPHLANLPANQFITNQATVTLTTPDTYPDGLAVSWPNATFTPPSNIVLASVDRTTGLLFGGMLESTTRYVQTSPSYSPAFAAFKPLLACTTAAVIIQKPDILPGYTWTPNPLGGYVGFIYRGKNAPLESCKNVLGSGTPETAITPSPNVKVTGRIEPFRINIADQY